VMGKLLGLLKIRGWLSGRKLKESEGPWPWLIIPCVVAWWLSMMKGRIRLGQKQVFSLSVEEVGLFVMRS
jgi:hypothetical protein